MQLQVAWTPRFNRHLREVPEILADWCVKSPKIKFRRVAAATGRAVAMLARFIFVSPTTPDTQQSPSPAYRSRKLRVISLAAALLRSHGRSWRPHLSWNTHEDANHHAGACRPGGLSQGSHLGGHHHPLHLRLWWGGLLASPSTYLHLCFFPAIVSSTAISADIDWRLVPNASPEGQAWVDASSAKFDGNTVIATYKWEHQGGTGFYLVSANCADSTITQIGGEFREKDGISVPKDPPGRTPQPAPSGTFAGAIHRSMCDLRPAWRRWLQ